MARIAMDDSRSVDWGTVRHSLRLTNLQLEAAVNALVKRKLIEAWQPIDAGDDNEVILSLTSTGVQYVVKNGLA